MARKALQLYRNGFDNISESAEDAKTKIQNLIANSETVADGELLSARYMSDGKVMTLLASVSYNGTDTNITFYEETETLKSEVIKNELVTEKGFEKVQSSCGFDENFNIDFGDDELLKDCTSLKDAILTIKNKVSELSQWHTF